MHDEISEAVLANEDVVRYLRGGYGDSAQDTRVRSEGEAVGKWKRARLTSAIELYDASGGLVSRFALNFPEYTTAAQPASRSSSWMRSMRRRAGEVRVSMDVVVPAAAVAAVGPSTSTTPYLTPADGSVQFMSVLSVGDTVKMEQPVTQRVIEATGAGVAGCVGVIHPTRQNSGGT